MTTYLKDGFEGFLRDTYGAAGIELHEAHKIQLEAAFFFGVLIAQQVDAHDLLPELLAYRQVVRARVAHECALRRCE